MIETDYFSTWKWDFGTSAGKDELAIMYGKKVVKDGGEDNILLTNRERGKSN